MHVAAAPTGVVAVAVVAAVVAVMAAVAEAVEVDLLALVPMAKELQEVATAAARMAAQATQETIHRDDEHPMVEAAQEAAYQAALDAFPPQARAEAAKEARATERTMRILRLSPSVSAWLC